MTVVEETDWRELEPTQENADRLFPPEDIGPIWQTDENGNWLLPKYTLGWEVIAWAEEWLSSPNDVDIPFQFTNEQLRVVLWMYAINEHATTDSIEESIWQYRKKLWQGPKGSGKDPFAAVISAVELIGPCRLSHWEADAHGERYPVAKPHPAPIVQLLGVSKAQAGNTMDILPIILNQRVRNEYNLDVQREIIYATGGRGKLQMVGANASALQGNRATFAVLNEIQHWVPSQGGKRLYNVIHDNTQKTGGHFLAISNAYDPSEQSIHQDIREEQEKVWLGLSSDSGWLYMSREAHPEAPIHPDWAPLIMNRVIGDAWWMRKNLASIAKDMLDGAREATQTRRMFYNQVRGAEDSFFSPTEWSAAFAEGSYGDKRDLRAGDEITLGFDGGKTDDATALVAIRIRDKLIVPLLIEQKPDGPLGETWRVQEHLVNEAVIEAFDLYKVRAFYADPALWQSWISEWNEHYREQLGVRASGHSSIAWEMSSSNQKIGRAWESFYDAIRTQRLVHNGDKTLRSHALNAKRGRGRGGLIARKDNPESPRKIDAMVAAYVAYAALEDYLQKGTQKKQYRRQMLRM